jgi:hypothetical protein
MTAARAVPVSSLRSQPRYRFDEALGREARGKIAPTLRLAEERGMATVMYLALTELHKSYPEMRPHELEALLQDILKQGD